MEENEIQFEEEYEEDQPIATEMDKRSIITQSSDPEIISLWNKWKRGKLILQPDFQRRFVWDRKKSSKLIESALLSVPLPIFYLAEGMDGKEYVIDGQQRLTAFFSFLDGKFPGEEDFRLTGLRVFPELNRKRYAELDEASQEAIQYYNIRTITILKESDSDLKFEIFERLNTGSVPLNDTELRNCVYRGPYMDLLRELSSDPDFRWILKLKEPDKRMKDVELVLRFAAFYHSTYLKYKPSMRLFLNNDMERYQYISERDANDLRTAFKNAVQVVKSIFGDNAFKRYYIGTEGDKNGSWEKKKFNYSLYDVWMGVFTDYDKNQLYAALDSIREGLIDLMASNEEFIESILIGTSDKKRVQKRFDLARKTVEDVLTGYKSQPRCFTLELKEILFDKNPTCAICGQRIQHLDDAAVDHIEQYWRGGKTIPENARLTHRYCNLARSKFD